MSDTKRTTLQVLCSVALALGLICLLAETRSTGEALETFKLGLSSGVVSAIGGGVALLSVVGFLVLYFRGHK